MAKEKKAQIPIQTMLAALDRGDKEFYANLSDELKGVFSAWLTMRWARSVKGPNSE